MFNIVSFILVLLIAVVLGAFPASINKCHMGDDDCLTKTTQEVLKNHPDGLPEINLIPIDPLHIDRLDVQGNPSGPVNVKLRFKNIYLLGLKDIFVKSVRGFNFKERTEMEAMVPKLMLKSEYIVDGHVLILPVTGKGDSIITCKNVHLKYSFDMKPVDIKGKEHAKIEHVKLHFKPEHVHFQFDNLYNGDKALGDNMNKVLNENWDIIYSDMEGAISKPISLTIQKVINNILASTPYSESFL